MLLFEWVDSFDSWDNGQATISKYAKKTIIFITALRERLRFQFLVDEVDAVIRLDDIAVTAV